MLLQPLHWSIWLLAIRDQQNPTPDPTDRTMLPVLSMDIQGWSLRKHQLQQQILLLLEQCSSCHKISTERPHESMGGDGTVLS